MRTCANRAREWSLWTFSGLFAIAFPGLARGQVETEATPTLTPDENALSSLGILQNNTLMMIIVGAILCLGGVLGYFLLKENRLTRQNDLRYKIAFWAALALSMVSFGTTLVGMYEFMRPKLETGDTEVFSIFLSVGVAFGVQVIMLVLALQLGERIIAARGVPGGGRPPVEARPRFLSHERFWSKGPIYIVLVGLIVLLLIATGAFSIDGFVNFFARALDGGAGGERPWLLIAVLSICIVICLFKLGWIGEVWGTSTFALLLATYMGLLTVSSLFSFDAYYRLIQTPQTLQITRTSVVREETADIRASVRDELDAVRDQRNVALKQHPETLGLDAALDGLVSAAERHQTRLEASRRNAIDALNAVLESQRAQQEARRQAAIRAASAAETAKSDSELLASELAELTPKISRIQSEVRTLKDEVEDARVEAEAAERLRDREEGGLEGTGKPGRGPAWRRLNDQLIVFETYLEQRRAALQEKEADLQKLLTRRAAATAEKLGKDSIAQSTDASPDQLSVVDASTNEAAKKRADDLIGQIAALENFNVGSAFSAFNAFLTAPSPANYQEYLLNCAGFLELLLRARVSATDDAVDPASFVCAPPGFVTASERLFAAQDAVQNFDTACQVVETERARAREGEQGFAAATRYIGEMLEAATLCVEGVGVTSERLREIARRATLLQSEYGGEAYDIRQSLNDLVRGDKFALGAIVGAVFVDLLILFVGLITAAARPSPLHDDGQALSQEAIESALIRIHHLPTTDGESPLIQFMRELRSEAPISGDDNLRMVIDLDEVGLGQESDAARSIILALGPYLAFPSRGPEGGGRTIEISNRALALINEIAHGAAGERTPPKAATDDGKAKGSGEMPKNWRADLMRKPLKMLRQSVGPRSETSGQRVREPMR